MKHQGILLGLAWILAVVLGLFAGHVTTVAGALYNDDAREGAWIFAVVLLVMSLSCLFGGAR